MTWSNDSLIAYGRRTIDRGEELLRAGKYLCVYTWGKIEYVSISTFLKIAKVPCSVWPEKGRYTTQIVELGYLVNYFYLSIIIHRT